MTMRADDKNLFKDRFDAGAFRCAALRKSCHVQHGAVSPYQDALKPDVVSTPERFIELARVVAIFRILGRFEAARQREKRAETVFDQFNYSGRSFQEAAARAANSRREETHYTGVQRAEFEHEPYRI